MKKEEMVCVNCNSYNKEKDSCQENPIPMYLKDHKLSADTYWCRQGEWNEETDHYDGAYNTLYWGDWEDRNTSPDKMGNILFRTFSLD